MFVTKKTILALTASAAMVLMVGTSPALALQAPQPAPQPAPQREQAKAPAPVQGELTMVDSAKKTITVKTTEGTEAQFLYTDATEVSGATEGVAGLAASKDSRVTVHFKEDASAKTKTATRIIVQPKQ